MLEKRFAMFFSVRSDHFEEFRNDRVPKHKEMTLGEDPLDSEVLSEVLGSLEDMKIGDIARTPCLTGCIMSDAALVIRALADKADIRIA
ncbi:hypothetical protein [Sulfitobacter sp. 915]|uniref:hypothetical protein n=1 Tax=Sulfitobacter sp. 915 TaxID=3368558 RepID=UPI003744C1DD